MATYGYVRFRLTQLIAGAVGTEIIDGWIQDVYTTMLDKLPWKRSESEIVIQAPVSYKDGTVTVTQGSDAVAGDATVWSTAMNGRAIRFNNEEAYYQFTCVNGTSATLDRPYEGVGGAGLSYRIDQPIYVLPANTRIIRGVVPIHDGTRPLALIPPEEINRIALYRNNYGTPRWAAAYWDNFSTPPRLQLELFPVPDCPNSAGEIISWSVQCVMDQSDLDSSLTSTTLLPWTRPATIIEGVLSKKELHLGNIALAQEREARFEKGLLDMARVNASQRGPSEIRLAPELRRPQGRIYENPFSKNFNDLVPPQ